MSSLLKEGVWILSDLCQIYLETLPPSVPFTRAPLASMLLMASIATSHLKLRPSRSRLDEVWHKFSGLGQISRTSLPDERDALDALLIREGLMCEFVIPGAQNTSWPKITWKAALMNQSL